MATAMAGPIAVGSFICANIAIRPMTVPIIPIDGASSDARRHTPAAPEWAARAVWAAGRGRWIGGEAGAERAQRPGQALGGRRSRCGGYGSPDGDQERQGVEKPTQYRDHPTLPSTGKNLPVPARRCRV